jgi:hypothetical protein
MLALCLLLLAAQPPLVCPKGTTYQREENVESCLDDNKKLHGPLEMRAEDGTVLEKSRYVHGALEADAWWEANGKPRRTQTWAAGKRDGVWEYFFPNGKVAWRRTFKNDALVKETLFDSNGTEQKAPKPGKTAEEDDEAGGLPKEVLGLVIRDHQVQVQYCYEVELQKDPKLEGNVTTGFTIGSDGSVSDVEIAENTFKSTAVADCIVPRIRKWQFPRPLGGGKVTIHFPWIFKPAADEK